MPCKGCVAPLASPIGGPGAKTLTRPRAFTIIDLLVSISVIAVLIGILLPSLSAVNETARRVVCQSNVRQLGLGVVMYANDYGGYLPPSRYLPNGPYGGRVAPRPDKMLTLRVPFVEEIPVMSAWDGLGVLVHTEYVDVAKVYYCPSHRGENPYSKFADNWLRNRGEIVSNYHYRGEGPVSTSLRNAPARTTRLLWAIDPAHSSLIADGMRVRSDYNHRVGVNFFRADLTIHWYDDPAGQLALRLPVDKEAADPEVVREAWHEFDRSANMD